MRLLCTLGLGLRPAPLLFVALLLPAAGAGAAAAMGTAEARHLLNRSGFTAHLGEIETVAKLSRGEAIERILAEAAATARIAARTPVPDWLNEWEPPRRIRDVPDAERRQFQRQQIERALELKGWWVREMITTAAPLTERMTLFWHNHFTSSIAKVRWAPLMYRQNLLLRRHALGNLRELLHAVARDPAMLVYLDSAANRRGQPNENFAREVMELFTLGEGNYSERDVREAARAFTGWGVDPQSGEFTWRPFAHDYWMKTVLGHSGPFKGEEVLDILLAQPQAAEFVVAKLWKEFVSPTPEPREVARIAQRFRASGYEVRTALRALLLSEAFWSTDSRGALVKSPVDLVIGTMRQFNVRYADPLPLTLLLRRLGQDLFAPPNVKGWPGGEVWINSTTLLARRQFLERLLRAEQARRQTAMAGERAARPLDARERLRRAASDIRFPAEDWFATLAGRDAAGAAQLLLLASAAPVTAANPDVNLIRRLVLDPAYQLK